MVHMNNVMSNLIFMDMADIRWRDLKRGIVSWSEKDENYQDALKHGAFGASYAEHEIKREVLDPILKELMEQDTALREGPVEGWLNAREWGAKMSVLGKITDTLVRGVKKADGEMVKAYQLEDEIFRMATYMHRRERGDTETQAARIARDQFLNYDIRAPWVNAARRSFLPFISYTYRAVPVIAKSISERPWKIAKYATVAYMMNAMGYLFSEGDEDDERKALNERSQGRTWLGTPRLLRMPFNDNHENPIFLDVRRWIPAGDVFDMEQSQGAIPVPAWLQFGGPLMIAGELALNKQAFTGKEIYNPKTDTEAERLGAAGMHMYRSWMPSSPWIPGSWYWNKIGAATKGGQDPLGREYNIPMAGLSSLGIKLQAQDVQLGMQYKAWALQSVQRELQWQLKQINRDLQRNLIDQDDYDEAEKSIRKKLKHLQSEAEEIFSK
mgnify:FL=1